MKPFRNAVTDILVLSFEILSMGLNLFGGLSGLWLLFLGEWGVVVLGLVYAIFSSLFISFALIPGLLISTPAVYFIDSGKKVIGAFFGFLSIIYTIALIIIWCMYVLIEFPQLVDSNAIIPILFWSYGVAMTPWIYLAQQDLRTGNDHAVYTTFFAEISYLIAIIMYYFGATLFSILVVFSVIMLVSATAHFLLVLVADLKKTSKLPKKQHVTVCTRIILQDIEKITDESIEHCEEKSDTTLSKPVRAKVRMILIGYSIWSIRQLDLFLSDNNELIPENVQDQYFKQLEDNHVSENTISNLQKVFKLQNDEFSGLYTKGEAEGLIEIYHAFVDYCSPFFEGELSDEEYTLLWGIPLVTGVGIMKTKPKWSEYLNS